MDGWMYGWSKGTGKLKKTGAKMSSFTRECFKTTANYAIAEVIVLEVSTIGTPLK